MKIKAASLSGNPAFQSIETSYQLGEYIISFQRADKVYHLIGIADNVEQPGGSASFEFDVFVLVRAHTAVPRTSARWQDA